MSHFPLPDDYFQPLHCTPEQLAQWKHRVRALVARGLRDELPVFASQYEDVDRHLWRLVKTKDQLRVYKPRRGGASAAAVTSPCVLAVGTIDGTLEDVVYGIHNATTVDFRVTRAFLSDTAIDAAVLHVFEDGTEGDDMYRSLALKWRAIQTPAGGFVKNRDACVLDYMGIERDATTGQRYAFHISESVDDPVCPPFKSLGVVRADVHIRTIYRELDANRVGVYFHAVYNMSGQIPKLFAGWTAATVAASVGNSVACAEAKKLTALALATQNKSSALQTQHTGTSCSICATARATLKQCRVCNTSVCAKCCSSKYVLTDAHTKVRVTCCTQCILAARHHNVDPRRPLHLVSSTAWTTRGELRIADDTKDTDNDDDGGRSNVCSEVKLGPHSVRPTQRPTWPVDPLPVGVEDVPSPSKPLVTSIRTMQRGTPRHADLQVATRVVQTLQHAHSHPPRELWNRMYELRVAAERAAQLTEEVHLLMEAYVEPVPVCRAPRDGEGWTRSRTSPELLPSDGTL